MAAGARVAAFATHGREQRRQGVPEDRDRGRRMTPERWARVVELFEVLADRPVAERAAMLAAACPDDTAVREEVARMLDSDANAGMFGESAAFQFTPVDADSSP